MNEREREKGRKKRRNGFVMCNLAIKLLEHFKCGVISYGSHRNSANSSVRFYLLNTHKMSRNFYTAFRELGISVLTSHIYRHSTLARFK